MTEARYLLTCPSRSLDAAQALADAIDEHIAIDVLAVTVHETDEAKALWNTVAYFADAEAANHAIAVLGLEGAIVSAVPQVDWVRESLLGLAPVTAGRFFLHGSHDRDRRRASGLNFEIDAGTAFGTGHHGTTAGCLIILDALLKRHKPRRIFDLGCGTGVLAIAAARATGALVLATDIDPEAVRVTKLNAQRNGLGPQVKAVTAAGLHHPVIRNSGPFDLVFANILARPLAHLAQGLSRLVAPGGTVILSGLTAEQQRWIAACYVARGLVPRQTVRIENWIAFSVERAIKGPKSYAKNQNPQQSRHGFGTGGVLGPGWEMDA